MFKRSIISIVLIAVVLSVVSCSRDRETRELQFMPDMYVSPAMKPQEADPDSAIQSVMREPVPGAIPREGIMPYQVAIADTTAANALVNPLPIEEDVLMVGQEYYDIFCTVCHGKTGAGDGPVVPKMTKPPVLYSEKVNAWPDGRIYHTITHGQGNMPSYKSSIDPSTRWAIIHYVRVLQRSQTPGEDDLKRVQQPVPESGLEE